jgi:hypothetical protein
MNSASFFRFISGLFLLFSTTFAQIKVEESSTSTLKINWEIENIDTIVLRDDNQKSVILSFKGQNTVVGADGEVALPAYSFFAGVPPQGDVDVSVVADQVTRMVLPGSPLIQQQKGKTLDQKQPEFISPWVSKPVYDQIRGIRTVSLIIRPAIYDKTTSELKVMKRGTITIKLPPAVQHTSIAGKSEFEVLLSELLCNYPIAKGWRVVSSGLKKRRSHGNLPLDNSKIYHFKVGDGFTDFNEGSTLENGLMKIPGSMIVSTFGVVPVSNVKLYASVKGELSSEIPAVDSLSEGIVEIPLLRVDSNRDGIVDQGDYFVAFVTGASDWNFNGSYEMNIDRYDDYRNYWLTTGSGGLSMGVFDGKALSSDTVLHHFIQPAYFVKNTEIPAESEGGLDWIWYKMSSTSTNFSEQLLLPGIDTSYSGSVRIRFDASLGSLRVRFGDLDEKFVSSGSEYDVTSWGDKKIRCEFNSESEKSRCEIKNIMAHYQRKLELPENENLTIFSKADSGNFTYSVSGLDGELVYIVRVSAEDNVALIDTVRTSSDGTCSWTDSGTTGVRYVVCRQKSLLSLPAHEEYQKAANVAHSVHDLRNGSNSTGYLIITHRDFIAQAESLAVHKEKMGYMRPAVVDVTDIYRLFSGGNIDPTAVRNFILYIKKQPWVNGENLDYVLLLGSAHYDCKQRKTFKPAFIPAYYKGGEVLLEDYFTITDPYTYYAKPSCAIGRITCETSDGAMAVVRKIKEYEDPQIADYGAWRNRALFVADDDMQGDIVDPITQMTPHHVSSDYASDELLSVWKSLDLRKVFLYEYEWDSSKRKPGAARAILNQINNGVGFVNYFGHGSYYIWADEEVLNLSDFGKLYNKKQYPLVASFSCSVGKFDQPGSECLSGGLLKLENAGAIAAISSSRASYAYSNEKLAINFYSLLVDSTRQIQSIGAMFVKAKIALSNESNRTYVLLGDPSIRFINSARNVELNIVDSKDSSLTDIGSMQLVKVKGKVLSSAGVVDNGYGSDKKPAYVQVGFFNPDDSTSRKDGGTRPMKYVLPGNPIFLGKTKVSKGLFEQSILVPKKVVFNKAGVRLTAFSWVEGENDCANGYRSDYIFSGSVDGQTNDTTGPVVSIQTYMDSTSRTDYSKDEVMVMQLSLYDPSGVDIIGTDPDDGLSMEIPGVISKRSINSNFQFKEGDFKNGTALIEIPVPSVKEESNVLIITARDLLGNLSETTFPVDFHNLEIKGNELTPNLDNVFNFPNPVASGKTTRFFFYRSEVNERFIPYNYRFVVKIYTLSGKLVKVFKDASNGIAWDCRDQSGRLLSPDVYLFQIQAYSSQQKKMVKSKIGKVVIHPPK